MLGLGIISPFLPEFVREHGANGFWMGMIFAGFAISRGIVMPIAGRMSDRWGRKIFVASGLLIFAIISLFYPRAASVPEMIIVRMVHGLSAGMIIPMVMAYVGDLAEKGTEGRTTGAVTMMFYLGVGSGPLIGGIINKFYGFYAVFYAMSALGFFTFFLVLFFLPRDVKLLQQEQIPDVHFRDLIKYNFIKAILLIGAVMTLMTSLFLSFVPSLANKIHIDTEHVGIILATGILTAGLLQIPSGRFADRLDSFGKLFQISAGTSVSMLAILSLPFCPDFHALLISGFFVGIGAAMSTPALMSLSVGVGQKVGMGSWMGIINTSMSIGFMSAPLIAGVIMDHLGIEVVFYVFSLVAMTGGLVYLHYVRKRMRGIKT